MPMVTDKMVTAGVKVRWGAVAALTALIPADRAYADRISDGTAWPAAAIRVTEGEVTRFGGAEYMRRFDLEIIVEARAEDGNAEAIRAALSAAFGGTSADATAGLTIPGATAVMHCLETDGGGIKPKPAGVFRQDGGDFLRVVSEFEILLHGVN